MRLDLVHRRTVSRVIQYNQSHIPTLFGSKLNIWSPSSDVHRDLLYTLSTASGTPSAIHTPTVQHMLVLESFKVFSLHSYK
jgi:hypothetical protein